MVSDARKQTVEVVVPRGLRGGAVLELQVPQGGGKRTNKGASQGQITIEPIRPAQGVAVAQEPQGEVGVVESPLRVRAYPE